jgi:isopentenyl-diphosphate delta-isomerase
MHTESVILVNEQDSPIGVMDKMEAHQKGLLHRAFSVFIFNNKKELLLQQRAYSKYHSAGLWTNTCCSHPRPGEDTLAAAHRRLKEEMGIIAELHHKGHFIYKTKFENGLAEHEYDHIYAGTANTEPNPNKDEVEAYVWLSVDEIKNRIKTDPIQFTYWFKIAMEKLF